MDSPEKPNFTTAQKRVAWHFWLSLGVCLLATCLAGFGYDWRLGCLALALWAFAYWIFVAVIQGVISALSKEFAAGDIGKDFRGDHSARKTSGRIN